MCLFAWLCLPAVGASARPNILLILADDLGYGDIGVYGGREIATPCIDSLATNGVRCTSGYVTAPNCSASRAGILTGRYQERFGHEMNPGSQGVADPLFGLPLTESTLATRLKPLGYATGAIGKWHLGASPPFHPLHRGFDEFFGFLGGGHSYTENNDAANPIMRGTNPVTKVSYTTDMFGDEASDFVERHKDGPWFLYLAFNAVHSPVEATERYLARFGALANADRRRTAACLSAMDDNVGKVLQALRATGQEDNTLIFFLSDNGGSLTESGSRNGRLNGGKGGLQEGGIRVPFLIQWKACLLPGAVFEQPVMAFDLFPTAVAAAGGEVSPAWKLDGVDLSPFLEKISPGPAEPHTALFWRQGADKWAVRMGDWKLRHDPGVRKYQLFNLAQDPKEKCNLAVEDATITHSLRAAWRDWNGEMAQPLWSRKPHGVLEKIMLALAAVLGISVVAWKVRARLRAPGFAF